MWDSNKAWRASSIGLKVNREGLFPTTEIQRLKLRVLRRISYDLSRLRRSRSAASRTRGRLVASLAETELRLILFCLC